MKNHRKALSIAKRALSRPNPTKKATGIQKQSSDIVAMDNMAMEFMAEGVDISSLSDAEWLDQLKNLGMSDDDAMMALENLAAYGVTDGP